MADGKSEYVFFEAIDVVCNEVACAAMEDQARAVGTDEGLEGVIVSEHAGAVDCQTKS